MIPRSILKAVFIKVADDEVQLRKDTRGCFKGGFIYKVKDVSPIKDEQDCLCLHPMSSFLEWIRSGNILCHRHPAFRCRAQTITRKYCTLFFYLSSLSTVKLNLGSITNVHSHLKCSENPLNTANIWFSCLNTTEIRSIFHSFPINYLILCSINKNLRLRSKNCAITISHKHSILLGLSRSSPQSSKYDALE